MSDEKKSAEKPAKKKKDVDQLLTEVTNVTIKPKPAAKAAPAPAPSPAPAPAPAAAAPAEAAAKPAAPTRKVRLRQVRSGICAPIDQKATLRGLGFTRMNQEVVRLDTPALRGQVHKVRHLVDIVGEG